jgi:hypothetical protein
VFNGDADGICSLHQLRLADPLDSTLVTGLKRDIQLLQAVNAAAGDVVTVLDISLDRNREALANLLEKGAVVRYFDHHYAGDIPVHPRLTTVMDDSHAACTSALVDRHLRGRCRIWAVVGAFGDGADATATELARPLGLDARALDRLRELGITLNYSAYGQSEADVLALPVDLYRTVSHYADPFDLWANERILELLAEERRKDLERVGVLQPHCATSSATVWVLPDAPWARRVSGTFANRLCARQPRFAHAVLTPIADNAYVVSVRAPEDSSVSAVEFCRRYPTGGGRVASAGVDRLEAQGFAAFIKEFNATWPARPPAKHD